MKGLSVAAFVVLAIAPATSAADEVLWTLSASATDPYLNDIPVEPFESGAPRFVTTYLWLVCGPNGGHFMSEVYLNVLTYDFGSHFTDIASYTFIGDGSEPWVFDVSPYVGGAHVSLWSECRDPAPMVVAELVFIEGGSAAPASPGFVVSFGDTTTTWDCASEAVPLEYIGFANDGSLAPQDLGGDGLPCSEATAVEPWSWGRTKSAYRARPSN